MTIYVLLFILFTQGGPIAVPGIFSSRIACQQAEAAAADAASKDPNIRGWVIVGDPCAAVAQAGKV